MFLNLTLLDALWTVPFPRNERFVGRTSELDQLSTRLSSVESCQRVAMVGLGGVGKTQIVLEFAYRKRRTTPDCSIVWIPATEPSAFEQAYRRVGTDLKIPGIAADGADVKYLVKESLSKHTAGPWLLIVDNADDSEMLFERKYGENAKYALIDYLPFSPNGSIIFTTRNRKAAIKQAANNIIHVGMMENDVAREALSKSLLQPEILDDMATTDQLLDLLDRLPMAIIQAAAYMNENDVTVAQYIELYNESEQEKIEMLSEHFEDEGRYREGQNSIATTWFISFKQIRQRSLVAIENLSFMACLLHQNIPQSVLPPATSKREFIEAIGILTAYSFVVKQDNGQVFSMHRLVHLATRNWLRTEGNLSSWTNKAFERLTEIIPAGGHKNRKVWTAYLPHAKHILTSLDMAEGHDKVIILSDHLGKCLYSNGQYIEAEQAHRNTLDLRMRSLGLDHPDTLDSSAFLAEALSHQGKFTEAEMLHKQTLRRRKDVLGAEHPDMMVSMQYLGQVFAGQGNYIQAEKMHREARDLRVKILGAENRNTLTSMSYLGEALNQQGRHKEAEQMHQQTLETRLRVLGLEYPATLASMSCLGVAQRNIGKYSDAEKTQRRVLEHRTRALGTRHPHTLITKRWLADALHHQRKYSESVEINQEVFDLQVQLLGPKNPDTLFTLSSLADTLHCQGKTDQAEHMHEEVLHLRVQSLGAEHPDTLKSKSSLAQILYEQGKKQEATDMQQQVLDQQVKSLGIEHPHTRSSKLTLENMQHKSLAEPPAQEV